MEMGGPKSFMTPTHHHPEVTQSCPTCAAGCPLSLKMFQSHTRMSLLP